MDNAQALRASFNWSDYRRYVYSKYRPSWAVSVFAYGKKYYKLLNEVRDIETLPKGIKTNVLKSLIILSKYLGKYKQFKAILENYGIKISRPNAVTSFLRIFNNSNGDILEWFKQASNMLKENERLYLKFALLTGLRAREAITSFNLIIKLANENKLSQYFNRELSTLEHFRFKDLFLRQTKNAFISIVPEELVTQIANSKPVSYNQIRNTLRRNNLKCRINELRDYFGSFVIRHGLIREEQDLLCGRIGISIFVRYYWSPSFRDLRDRTLKAIKQLQQTL